MSLYSHEAEKAVIGALSGLSRADVGRARLLLEKSGLSPDDFHLPLHASVWRALAGLLSRKLAVDRVSLAGELPDAPQAELVALLHFEAALLGFDGFAATIRDLSLRRRAHLALLEASAQLKDTKLDPMHVISSHAQTLARLSTRSSSLRTVAESLDELMLELEAVQSGVKSLCIPTGIVAWDAVLGGLEPGTATFIGAQAGVGKSALLATILRNLALSGVKSGVFSLEDMASWIPRRLLSDEAAVPLFVLAKQKMGRNQYSRARHYSGNVRSYGQHIIVDDRSMLTVAQIEQTARDMILNRGCRVLVVDHLGKIDYQAGDFHRHDLAISDALSRLIGLAKTYSVPLLIAAHFKNTGEGAKFKEPELNDFAQAMFIGRDARAAVGLYIPGGEDGKPLGDVMGAYVLKQTSGMADVKFRLRRLTGSGLIANESEFDADLRAYGEQEREMVEAKGWQYDDSESH